MRWNNLTAPWWCDFFHAWGSLSQGAVLSNWAALNSTGTSLALVSGFPRQEAGLEIQLASEKSWEQAFPLRPEKSYPWVSWLFYLKPSPSTNAAILVPCPSPHLLKFNFWLLLKDPPNLCEAMTQKHSLESDVGLTYALKWEAWLYRLGEKEVYSYSANQ